MTNSRLSYLKVAVHPDEFQAQFIKPNLGIVDCINLQSKSNRHHSSNYLGGNFPRGIPGKHEPYGKCYKVLSLDTLSVLLAALAGLNTADVSLHSSR